MKKDWTIKKLGEVCEVIAGQSPEGKFYNQNHNGTPFYQGKKDFGEKYLEQPTVWTTLETKIALENDILMSVRAPVGDINICNQRICIGRGLAAIRPSNKTDKDYLFYYLLSEKPKIKGKEGAVFASINRSEIAELNILLPPLEEQKRIVAVLDKKFAQIETLKTAAVKNLQNTKQLFQAELEKAFSNTSWETKRFSDLFKLTSGEYLNSKSIIKGQYPIYGGNGIIAYHNEYNLTGDNIIIGRVGALCGNVRFLSEPIWLTDNAFKLSFLKDPFDYKFLTYLLNFKDLRKYARQAAQPVISNSSLKDIEIPLLPLEEQKRIVAHLDSLSEKVHRLEEIYTKQISDCDELKQSLLAKAFEGNL